MNNRKLTPDQIDDLYLFCREHYVHQYDLQIELVDHMGSAIEQKWEENPKLTYDNALWSVFGEFGIYGFSKIRKAKEKALRKKYLRLQWRYIGEFYRLPKIILTAAITLALFTVFRIFENDMAVTLIILGLYLIGLLVYILFFSRIYRIDLVPGKSFLLYDHLKTARGGLFALGFAPINLFNCYNISSRHVGSFQFSGTIYWDLIFAFMITFFGIIMIVVAVYIPKRIKEDFLNEFPQFVND